MTYIKKFTVLSMIVMLGFIPQSCDNSDEPVTVIDAYVDIYFKNSNGLDLLNPDSEGLLDTTLFSVYYLIDGEERLVNESNLEFSKGFAVFPPEGNRNAYFMRLFLNIESPEDITTTILRHAEFTDKTFLAEINNGEGRNNNVTSITKIWLNGVVVYGPENVGQRLITITE